MIPILMFVGIFLVSLFAYFIPALIAAARRHHNALSIAVLNLLLGWTVLGWIVALVWSLTATSRPLPTPSIDRSSSEIKPAQGSHTLLERAIQTGTTDFGSNASQKGIKSSVTLNQRAVGPDKHRKARVVSWTINGDGTATCQEDGLQWIQAPWGMQWEGGSNFVGEPFAVTWIDAQRLFGCGVRMGLAGGPGGTIGLSQEQFFGTRVEAGYTRGTCRLNFAGHDDWRLPTLADWYTVLGLNWEPARESVLALGHDRGYWTSNERHEPIHEWPWRLLTSRRNCAWSANVDRWVLDSQVDERLPIMFVRTA